MKQILLLAGAGLLLASGPALAKPDKGHGKGHGTHSTLHGDHKGKAHGKHHKSKMYGYSARGCPPGLAKHEGYCMPHGQHKKLYASGQRYPAQYGNQWNYNHIPNDLRSQYGFNQDYRYYYGDGYLYQVDPRTNLINQVVNAITR